MNYPEYVHHQHLKNWVKQIAHLTKPADIYWCDGSEDEYNRLCDKLVENGTFKKLNPEKRPNSYLALSDPGDVARVEDRTFICSARRTTPARPTTGCIRGDEGDAQPALRRLHARPHDVRHPVQHGPARLADISHIGIEITDSPTSS
jgi:phosphoenolpyruvate carboxykinase (GTP)